MSFITAKVFVNLLGLTLMKKILIFLKPKIKYLGTLKKQIKN